MIIRLESWEYEHASTVGIRRFTERWDTLNAAHYDISRMEDDRTAQVAACIAELAVAKHLNQYWSGHVWKSSDHHTYKHLADVGRNIEVRRVRTRPGAAVRRKQVGKGLVLWVAQPIPPEFMAVDLWGWLDYDKAWDIADPSGFNEDTRYVPRERLIEP